MGKVDEPRQAGAVGGGISKASPAGQYLAERIAHYALIADSGEVQSMGDVGVKYGQVQGQTDSAALAWMDGIPLKR